MVQLYLVYLTVFYFPIGGGSFCGAHTGLNSASCCHRSRVLVSNIMFGYKITLITIKLQHPVRYLDIGSFFEKEVWACWTEFFLLQEMLLNEKCLKIENGGLKFSSAIAFVSTQILRKRETMWWNFILFCCLEFNNGTTTTTTTRKPCRKVIIHFMLIISQTPKCNLQEENDGLFSIPQIRKGPWTKARVLLESPMETPN